MPGPRIEASSTSPQPRTGSIKIIWRSRMAPLTQWLGVPGKVRIYTLTRRLLMILKVRTFAQMVWAYALRSIAAMQQVLCGPNAASQKPRDMMSALRNAGASIANIKRSIALFFRATKPEPTILGPVNLFPKALCEGTFHAVILP